VPPRASPTKRHETLPTNGPKVLMSWGALPHQIECAVFIAAGRQLSLVIRRLLQSLSLCKDLEHDRVWSGGEPRA
jgi:hypothetical protein